MSDSNSPIFIVGWPRSGTTLLAKMLAAHPRLCCGPETHLFSKFLKFLVRSADAKNWPEQVVEAASLVKLASQPLLPLYLHSEESFREELICREPNLKSVLLALYANLLKRTKTRRVVEKTPNHMLHVKLIRTHFPNSPIIRIVRDPRDSAISMGKLSWMPDCPIAGALIWRRWFDSSKIFFEKDALSLTIRFEELVENTELCLRRLCLFVGEEYNYQMLDYHVTEDTVSTQAEVWKKDVSEKIMNSTVYRWKSLPAYDFGVSSVSHICGDIINYFNYECNDVVDVLDVKELALLPPCYVGSTYRAMAVRGKFTSIPVFYGSPRLGSLIRWNARSVWIFIASCLRFSPRTIVIVRL